MRAALLPLMLLLAALALAPAAGAADVHLDARDLAGPTTLAKQANGNWLVDFPGGSLTIDQATADAWATQIHPPPPKRCANGLDDDGDGLTDLADPGCADAADDDEFNIVQPPPPAGTQGDVKAFLPMQSGFDAFLLAAVNDTAAPFPQQDYVHRLARARTYQAAPTGSWPADKAYAQNNAWMPRGWTYADGMVASYTTGTAPADQYLRDRAGNKLYIDFGAHNQWAADLGNPAFRQRYIDSVAPKVAESGGLFVDDANIADMKQVVSDVNGNNVGDCTGTATLCAWNPRTNAQMTQAEWGGYWVTFVREMRARFPGAEIVLNTVPFHGAGVNDPNVRQAIDVADGWEMERGFGDANISAAAFETTFKAFIDYAHSVGTFVVHDVQSTALPNAYTEAAYLCTNAGQDYYGRPEMLPASGSTTVPAWSAAWDLDLGAATSACAKGADGVFRRGFERGSVTVNPVNRTGTIVTN